MIIYSLVVTYPQSGRFISQTVVDKLGHVVNEMHVYCTLFLPICRQCKHETGNCMSFQTQGPTNIIVIFSRRISRKRRSTQRKSTR